MQPLTVLLTNNALGQRAGSETYLRDVALALLRRGHTPLAFSLEHGEVAAELRQATIPVLDDLERLGAAPDVIHGHHHLETLMAALALPGVPIVQFCHGWLPWEELPLRHPSVRRYVAVDEVCRDRLLLEEGVAPDRVDVVLNFVDRSRFRPRSPLPPRPSRALVFSNSAGHDGYVRAIRSACDAAGIHLDVMGLGSGAATSTPEVVLRDYDLVFAKARSALEALVVGCAVVLADRAGCGPLVTSANYDRLRPRNFGIRELGHPHEPGWYAEQIARFDAADAAAVSTRARADADLERAVDRLTDIYMHAIAAPGQSDPPPSTAAYRHLRRISAAFKQAHAISVQLHQTMGELQAVQGERDRQAALAAERLRELLLSRQQNWSRLPAAALRRLRAGWRRALSPPPSQP
jgi:hypothetical protein